MIISKRSFITALCLLLTSTLFAQESKPTLKIGGALRYNYNLSSWKKEQVKRGGDFGFDTFIINAKAQYKGVKLIADYRLYSKENGGGFLKKGWLEYDFNPHHNLQLGLTQVPFGIGEYNSHSYFFSMNYYIGLEDDYDMGIKYGYKNKHWDIDLAFFKNAEEMKFGNDSDLFSSRYSYDIASMDVNGDGKLDYRAKELNQLNARFVYKLQTGEAKHRFGLSGQFGQVRNMLDDEYGQQQAFAGHYQLDWGGFNAKFQATYYQYKTYDSDNSQAYLPISSPDRVAMTAFGYPYLVAWEGATYTAGLAYTIPIKSKLVSSIQLYNDFSILNKSDKGFENSYMNILGTAITAGNIFMYVDYAIGKNQPWLGGNWTTALAQGDPNAKWESRFNINLGYYF